jgi:hypothetical protein
MLNAASLFECGMTQYRAPRRAVMLKVHTRSAMAGEDHAVLRNISATGLSARMTCPCFVGERVGFDIPGPGYVEGVVRWVRQNLVGVEFDHPIDMSTIAGAAAVPQDVPVAPTYARALFRDVGSGKRPGFGRR